MGLKSRFLTQVVPNWERFLLLGLIPEKTNPWEKRQFSLHSAILRSNFFVARSIKLLNLCAMFIRNRKLNKPLAGYVLVLFLLASAFTQSSGTISFYVINALGPCLDKSNQLETSVLPFACTGTEEEKKSEHKSVGLYTQGENLHTNTHPLPIPIPYPATKIAGRTTSPIFLLNKSLRL